MGDSPRSVTAARVPSQCATSAAIRLLRVNGAIVKLLTVSSIPTLTTLTSNTLPEPVPGVPLSQATSPPPSAPTTRPSNTPTRPPCHRGLPAHLGCQPCVITVSGVTPRPRSARTSLQLLDANKRNFENYQRNLFTTVQTATLVLTYTMSRHHQTECYLPDSR